MRVYNRLSLLLECVRRWSDPPSLPRFTEEYFEPMRQLLRPMLSDWGSEAPEALHGELRGLNWSAYRQDVLAHDPSREEARLRRHLREVEQLLQVRLEGEVVLFGAFGMMDGYARFHRGKHRVFLGIDGDFSRGSYLDILMVHELTHVAREGLAEVWQGYGLDPAMTHDQFVETLPVVEHLFSEGLSCLISELLVTTSEPWHYVYQSKDSLARALKVAPAIDEAIHHELAQPDGNYGKLYSSRAYRQQVPPFCHYVWAWQWVSELYRKSAREEPHRLLRLPSSPLLKKALGFRLPEKFRQTAARR